MALAIKFYRLSSQSLLRNKGHLYSATRCSSNDTPLPWNYLWEPGKYSKEKHNEIAEKYHMHPNDYKLCPEDEEMGDYPNLPMIGLANKDPYYPYDIPVIKKNYHEIMHPDFAIMTEDRSIVGYKYRYSPLTVALVFFATIFGYFGIIWATDSYQTFQPMMEKQLPYTGKVHYTFELVKKEI